MRGGGGNSLKPSGSAGFERFYGAKFGVRKGAFTLAEVLITLGIIGVVAALTLPSLIQKHQDQVLENRLKKMYSTLSQGVQKAMADDGVSNFYYTELFQSCIDSKAVSNTCIQMVKKYFNVVAIKTEKKEYYHNVIRENREYNKDGVSDISGYYRDKSKRERYPHPFVGYGNYPIYVLADGSEFTFAPYHYGMLSSSLYSVTISIDTNGEKGPNTQGFDIFGLNVNEDSILTGHDFIFEAIQRNNWKFPW